MKWKCHNCGNVFFSNDGDEWDEFEIHSEKCFDLENFFEILTNESKGE